MFSLRDLRFALCSLELDVQRVQRIMGFLLGPALRLAKDVRSTSLGKYTSFQCELMAKYEIWFWLARSVHSTSS